MDEKIPYALDDLMAMPMPAALIYAGQGFSEGVLHLLQSSELAAYCLPGEDLERQGPTRSAAINSGTWQLDHILAMTYGWWDLLIGKKQPISLE